MSLRTLDDTDPAVQYGGGWGSSGDPQEYNSTTSFTTTIGATARVTFTGELFASPGINRNNADGSW